MMPFTKRWNKTPLSSSGLAKTNSAFGSRQNALILFSKSFGYSLRRALSTSRLLVNSEQISNWFLLKYKNDSLIENCL